MRSFTSRAAMLVLTGMLIAAGAAGCKEDSDDAVAAIPSASPQTLNGTWGVTVAHNTQNAGNAFLGNVDHGDCGEGYFETNHVFGIVQLSATLFQIVPWEGTPINATLVGDRLSFDLPLADGLGVTTSHVELTFISTDGDQYSAFSGEFSYTYNEDGWGTCSGTDSWDGVKASGDYAGLWGLEIVAGATDCVNELPIQSVMFDNFPLGDNGESLLITVPGSDELIEAMVVGDQAMINHTYTDEGDRFIGGDEVTVTLTGQLTIAPDGNTIGGLDGANAITVDVISGEDACSGEINLLFTR
ncbi:MAG: hypothetical protein AAF581_15155 [Planctomycetota bacterium]